MAATFSVAINALRAKAGAKVFQGAVRKIRGEAASTEKTMKSLKGALFGTFAGLGLLMAVRKMTAAVVEQENTIAQLRAGLQSTNGVSGQTISSLQTMAREMQALTRYSNEEIEAAQGIILSFTQISGDVFPRTVRAAGDVAARMGTDMKSASIQLAKALNDPIQNLGLLSRSGIQFTQASKDVIKALVLENKLFEAQSLILDEIETQYKGSAEAARDTLGGALASLKNEFDDLLKVSAKESGFAGALKEMAEFAATFFSILNGNQTASSEIFLNLADYMNRVNRIWRDMLIHTKMYFKILGVMAKTTGQILLNALMLPIRAIITAFGGMIGIVVGVFEGIVNAASYAVTQTRDFWQGAAEWIAEKMIDMAIVARTAFSSMLRGLIESASHFKFTAGAIEEMSEALVKNQNEIANLRDQKVPDFSEGADEVVVTLNSAAKEIKEVRKGVVDFLAQTNKDMTVDVTTMKDLKKIGADTKAEIKESTEQYVKQHREILRVRNATDELTVAERRAEEQSKKLQRQRAEAAKKQADETKRTKQMFKQLGDTIGKAFEDMIFESNNLKESMRALGKEILKVIFRRFVTEKIAGGITGMFAKNGMVAMANGGVVAAPTTALIGESGAEAVMPLSRGSDGKLGVKSEGGSGGTTNVTNNYIQAFDHDSFMQKMTSPTVVRAQSGAARQNNQMRKGY